MFSGRCCFSSTSYKFYVIKNGREFGRLGIIAKKYIGNAVKRNYEKRLIRELFRQKSADFIGLDVVVVIRDTRTDFKKKKECFSDFISFIRKRF